MIYRWIISAVVIMMPIISNAAGSHSHDTAHLRIAIDGNLLNVNVEMPLNPLIGFEHAPKNAQQKAAVTKMETTLREAKQLFIPNMEAACRLMEVHLDSIVLGDHPVSDQDDHAHAELEGEYAFQCDHPEKLNQLIVNLFDAFPRLKHIKTEAVTPKGQSAMTLTPRKRGVSLN